MPQKRKLQVFVSSTFEDLKSDRQAAVEAILKAGHIPAGMELFTSGDESQMQVIKRWIDESDVYMLILGGRYGSIDPKTEKSYTHLEYEYALQTGKPLFAVVIKDDYLEKRVKEGAGTAIIETKNPQKLAEFRTLVQSNIVEFWESPDQLKLAVMGKLLEYSLQDDLKGWVRAEEAVSLETLNELARLSKENSELKEQMTGRDADINGLREDLQNLRLLNSQAIEEGGGDTPSPVFHVARLNAAKASCRSFMQQLGLAMAQLELDYNERFPDCDSWCDDLLPYVRNQSLFSCPAAPDIEFGYAMNRALSGLPVLLLEDTSRVPLLFDCSIGTKNASGGLEDLCSPPRHIVHNNILFADGHVQAVKPEDAANLVWNPKMPERGSR